MKEREVSLTNLLIDILLHWRSLILVAMLGMISFGVFAYVQSAKSGKESIVEILVYAIIGAILATVVYVFAFIFTVICDPHISITDELEDLFSIAQLGLIIEDRKSTKFMGKIDDAIVRLRDRNKRRPTEVRALKLAYVAVGLIAEKNGFDTIYLVGCNIKGHSAYVCEQLKIALEKKGFHVEVLNNVLYEPEAMSKLEQAQSVVLVEKAGSTLYKEVQREVELMNRLNIDVWGGIIVQ